MSIEQLSEWPEAQAEEKEEKALIEEYQKRAGKYFGEGKGADCEMYTAKDQGFWYFSPRPKEEGDIILEQGLKINDLQDQAVRALEQGKGAEFMGEHFDEICQEYKIHLQPTKGEYDQKQGDYRPFYVNKLMEALAENPEFRESIDRFKVSYQKEAKKSSGGEAIPEIVIYPRYGRENFGKALSRVFQQFKGREKWGNNVNPRFNHKINELIFIAQSGGDFKEKLRRLGVLDNYFDEKFNHAIRKGEKPPLSVEDRCQ